MEKLKIKDEDTFIEIFKVISWLDKKRWTQKIRRPDKFAEEILEDTKLKPAQKILVHWLIYITDRGKRADLLWDDSTPKIKELVEDYFKEDVSREERVTELCKNWEERYSKKEKIWAYPADLESIKRTLIILLDYSKDIINFMTRRLAEYETRDPEKFCPRVAFSLYLLSYKDVGSLARGKDLRKQNQDKISEKREETKNILKDNRKFEDEFEKWYNGDKRWHKRTWAALRDYKKFELLSPIFIEGIIDKAVRDIWRKDFTKQLELPGDIWNIRFFKKCIEPRIEGSLKGKKTPYVIRELWKQIESKCPEAYPEQFDVTFDFAPRMCSKKLCDVCLFGPNGAESICIPTDDKYCPAYLLTCGYIAKCTENQSKCIIKEGIGKRTCKVA